jgi:hypothetical protein
MQNRLSLSRIVLLPSSATQPGAHVPSFGCYRRFDDSQQFLNRDFPARLVIVERVIQLHRVLADHKNYCIGPAPANVLGGVTQVVLGKGVVKYGDIH